MSANSKCQNLCEIISSSLLPVWKMMSYLNLYMTVVPALFTFKDRVHVTVWPQCIWSL